MRILLVDDDETLLRTYCRVLRDMELDVVTASSVDETTRLLDRSPPGHFDAALVDLVLEAGSGLELLPLIRRRCPAARLALVTGYLDADIALEAQAQGVVALPKPLQNSLLRDLIGVFASQPRVAPDEVFPQLTRREAEVVHLATLGLGNEAIGEALDVTRRTVETHWRRIYKKTGMRTQRELLGCLIQSLARSSH